MQPWHLMLAGLAASCFGNLETAVQDFAISYLSDQGASDNDRRLSSFTYVCPRVLKHSKAECDRCLSDEMCPSGYVCHSALKKCTNSIWNGSEVLSRCTENVNDYSSWSAHCVYVCDEQSSPFACSQYCVNEDFPCRWVPDCHTPSDLYSMSSDATACLRGCEDHDAMLQVELRNRGLNVHTTCRSAITEYGCTNQYGARIQQICPVSCLLGECQYRCGRDEEAGVDGKQCWDRVMNDKYSCSRAISLGYDCHCKCSGAYLTLARTLGGAFKPDMAYHGESVGLNITVTTNETFSISLTGQAMRIDDLAGIWGPRLKVIDKGGSCRYNGLSVAVSQGLHCHTGTATTLGTTANICTIAPSKATPYLHRWTDIGIGHCGEFDVCHCNWKCEIAANWHLVGRVVATAPAVEAGSIRKAYPGCVAPVPDIVVPVTTDTDKREASIIRTSFAIYAVLKSDYEKNLLHASKQALVAFISSNSELLGKQSPEASDVTVTLRTAPRRLESFLSPTETRRLANCTDDETAFAEEAAKVNIPYGSCQAMLASGVELNVMCADSTLYTAIIRGCQKTCNACGGSNTPIPFTLPASLQGTERTFDYEISVETRGVHSVVVARINYLKTDPAPYVQRLFVELEDAEVPQADLPPQMWVSVVSGPDATLVDLTETASGRSSGGDSDSSIFIIFGIGLGGSLVIGILFVLCWYLVTRKPRGPKKGYQTTITEISEGGYRRKNKTVEVADQEERELDCCEKFCKRLTCGYCCKTTAEKRAKLKKPQTQAAWPDLNASTNLPLSVGCTVMLTGLNKQEYNGLTAEVLSGPDDRGRYKVDLKVDVGASNVEEHREISLKPDNMRVIQGDLRQTAAQSVAAARAPGPPGSYRNG